jgi:hypothetical protein
VQTDHQTQHAQELLTEVATYPLLSALFGRRARRFGLGMSIPDGPLAYTSQHEPIPLNDLERTLLGESAGGILASSRPHRVILRKDVTILSA